MASIWQNKEISVNIYQSTFVEKEQGRAVFLKKNAWSRILGESFSGLHWTLEKYESSTDFNVETAHHSILPC